MFFILTVSIILGFIHPVGDVSLDRNTKFVRAESYYLNNDLFISEKIFKDILREPVVDDIRFNSMSRLIDIAQKDSDKGLFREILPFLKGNDKNTTNAYNSLLYTIGKYLLQTGEYKTSINFLNLIDKKNQVYPESLYLKASGFAGLKRYSDALFNYEILIRMKNENITKDVRDAAILGKARVYVLMKKHEEALSEYQKIDTLSQYYLRSLEEIARLFVVKKDYDQALSQIETLVFINKKLYLPKDIENVNEEESFNDLNLMKLKILQGYLYIDQERYDESKQVFDEIIIYYNKIKKEFNEELNRFKLSEDLTQVLSHPHKDGTPRSIVTNPYFIMFGDNESYSRAFRDWLTEKEKRRFLSDLRLYYSVLQRTKSIESKKKELILSDDEVRLVEFKNVMNVQMKEYINFLMKKINAQLDEIGLKAQLGKIDIVWRTKENQTKKIKEIQEKKQENIERIENKYRNILE